MLASEKADLRVLKVMKYIKEHYTEKLDVYQMYTSIHITCEWAERRKWRVMIWTYYDSLQVGKNE